jgi:hypothetical protein
MDKEVGFPMFEVVKRLRNNTLESLSSVSKTINKSVTEQVHNPLLWKYKLEKLLKLTVPFGNNTSDYWKDLYYNVTYPNETYSEDKLLKALESGKYEYVWIAIQKDVDVSSALLRQILTNITNLRGIDTLMYMLDNVTIEEDASAIVLRTAIYNNDTEMFNDSLSLLISNGNNLREESIAGLTQYSIQKHNVDILQVLLNFDAEVAKGKLHDLYTSIAKSRTTGQVKARMLELVLAFVDKGDPPSLYDYESLNISVEEIQVMLNSTVILEGFWDNESVDVDVANLLYYSGKSNDDMRIACLGVLIKDDALLFDALKFRDTIQIPKLWVKHILLQALHHNNNSLAIIGSKFANTKQLSSIFHDAVVEGKEIPFLYLCRALDVTVNMLETSIMLSSSTSFEGKIPLFVESGVPINFVGEKLAFNADVDVIKQLHKLGFQFKRCIDDLLFHFRDNKEVTKAILDDLNFTPEKHDYKDTLSRLDWLKHELLQNNYRRINEILDGEAINWSIYGGSIFSNGYSESYRHPELNHGAKIVAEHLAKNMLRGLDDDIDHLVKYLNVALFGVDSVKINRDYDTLTYQSGIIVEIRDRCEVSKYKGLDMYSSNGYPLTTREAIKARRRELLPR